MTMRFRPLIELAANILANIREETLSAEDIAVNRAVAIYWDVENLHAALVEAKNGEGAYAKQDNRSRPQEP